MTRDGQMRPVAMYDMKTGAEVDLINADRATKIIRLQRQRDKLAARIKPGVVGVTKLRVRLEQACHDLMKLEQQQ